MMVVMVRMMAAVAARTLSCRVLFWFFVDVNALSQ